MKFAGTHRRLSAAGCRRLAAGALSLVVSLSTVGCRAQQPWPLWDSYKAHFLDSQGRVIDHSAGDRSTTEGEAYAMFFALVANDRTRFDKLLAWTEDNLAQGDLTSHLPAWSWGKAPDGSWRVLDGNSASDADLWMAYALCEAGRLWHVDRYSKLGNVMAARVAREEVATVPTLGTTLLPGEQGFHPNETTWYVNPSYLPPPLLAYFAHRVPEGPWGQVLASLPSAVQTSGGFAMDWMVVSGDSGVQPSASPGAMTSLQQGQSAPTPVGSFDAIRVYLWAGIADPRTPHVSETLAALRGMVNYLNTAVTPPQQVGHEGQVLNPSGAVGFSAAVIPYLRAQGRKSQEKIQADRVAAMLDSKSGLYGRDGLYYDQNLVMFEEGWATGRYRFDREGTLHVKWK